MNCPHCGTKNEENARFCADCGAPLEGQGDEDSDRTIMSSVKQISEEAKTVAVSQDDLNKLADDMAQAQDAEFEPEPASPPPSMPAGGSNNGQKSGFFTQRNIIIMVVVLVALCLCCCVLAGIGSSLSNVDFSQFR
jgi:hypothetical protein